MLVIDSQNIRATEAPSDSRQAPTGRQPTRNCRKKRKGIQLLELLCEGVPGVRYSGRCRKRKRTWARSPERSRSRSMATTRAACRTISQWMTACSRCEELSRVLRRVIRCVVNVTCLVHDRAHWMPLRNHTAAQRCAKSFLLAMRLAGEVCRGFIGTVWRVLHVLQGSR